MSMSSVSVVGYQCLHFMGEVCIPSTALAMPDHPDIDVDEYM